MLLAVGIIAASAFIQNHECWGQVCTTGPDQYGQNSLIESILPTVKGKQKTAYKRKVPRPRIRMNEQDLGEEKLE